MITKFEIASKGTEMTDKFGASVRQLVKAWEDEEFWAWLAGFWEGEGSLNLYADKRGGNRTLRPLLTVSQSDRAPIDYIYERLRVGGVSLDTQRGKRNYMKAENRVIEACKDCWIWQVQSKREVLEILQRMLPHLRFKADEVRQAITVLKDELKKAHWSKWTPTEIEILEENYGKVATSEIAKLLNRTVYSVQLKARMLGLKKVK
jgi:hypothetical protein